MSADHCPYCLLSLDYAGLPVVSFEDRYWHKSCLASFKRKCGVTKTAPRYVELDNITGDEEYP